MTFKNEEIVCICNIYKIFSAFFKFIAARSNVFSENFMKRAVFPSNELYRTRYEPVSYGVPLYTS